MSGKRGANRRGLRAAAMREHAVRPDENEAYTFSAEHDDDGVYFYQAYNDGIADWAVEHGTLGCVKWVSNATPWLVWYRCSPFCARASYFCHR